MGCGCGNTQVSAAVSGGDLVTELYQTVPTRADVEAKTFSDRGEAELYLAANGGGHVKTSAGAAA